MSRRTRVQREWAIEQVELNGQASAPIVGNRWLITGADTMSRVHRTTLRALLAFHRYTRDDVMDRTREAFVATWPLSFERLLKYEYKLKKFSDDYAKSPFLALLPKRSGFGAVSP